MAGRFLTFIRKTPVLRLPDQFFGLIGQWLKPIMPRGLRGRFTIIIGAPIILILFIASWLYMERYSQQMTRRLSNAVGGEIAFLVSVAEMQTDAEARARIFQEVSMHEALDVRLLEGETLPPPIPIGRFNFLRRIVDDQLQSKIAHPVWFDLEHRPSMVEVQVQLSNAVLAVEMRRSRIIATNWHNFLVWMFVAVALFLGIAVLFLRIQVRAILRLALAAESFGKGRDVPDFKPSGASEVRKAAEAVIDMRDRISAYAFQRTEMLAGVSHDLRTPLTRLKLQLAILGDGPDVEEMKSDIAEMEYMLQEYLDFARGQAGEETRPIDVPETLELIIADAARKGQNVTLEAAEPITFLLREGAFRRLMTNLINNAATYGDEVKVSASLNDAGALLVRVDDNGPGIPPDRREEAFRPFHRLDEGRNQDQAGTGLGLAIALDVAKAHGGDIALEASPLGGLRAKVTLPG